MANRLESRNWGMQETTQSKRNTLKNLKFYE